MDNIIRRKQKADMGSDFEDWAYCYFAEDGENVNTPIVRELVYEDFITASKSKRDFGRCNAFTKALRSFAELCPYIAEMNPIDLLNKSGRYLQKIDGKTKEMIFMRTKLKNGEPVAFVPQTESSDGNARSDYIEHYERYLPEMLQVEQVATYIRRYMIIWRG